MSDAISRGARGGGVTIAGQAVKILIQATSVVVLSRLLSPEDFGLVAMVSAFVALGELIRDFGTSIVGLQRRELSQQQASNLFWLATGLGLLAAILLTLCTPLLVGLYHEPRLSSMVPVLALSIVLHAMAAQLQVQLARVMRYARLVGVDIAALLCGLAAAIVGALAGWGYWALVAQVLVSALAGLLLRWIASGWQPSLPRRDSQNVTMVRDSATFGLAQLLTYFSQNLDTIIVGARWDATSLGFYTRAYQLLTTPLNSLMGPLTQVVIPTVNRAVAEGRTIDSVLVRLQFALGTVLIWIYFATAGVADWLIPFALGENWGGAVVIFQILAAGGSVWVFSRVSYWSFVARNMGRALLSYNIATKSLSAFLIFGASFISVEAVAWSVSIGLIVAWPINLVWLSRSAGQRSLPYFWGGMHLVSAGAVGYLTTAFTFAVLEPAIPWVAATIAVIAGTVVYVAAIAVVPAGRKSLLSSAALISRAIRRRRPT